MKNFVLNEKNHSGLGVIYKLRGLTQGGSSAKDHGPYKNEKNCFRFWDHVVYNNPLLTTRRSNEVYNLTSKKQHVFPFDFDKITGKVDLLSMSLRNILVDLFLSEDKIYFISMAKNGNVFCYYLNEFDRETFKLIRCREFYFPSAYQIRQMVFKNASSLLGINNDHELVEISIPDFLDHWNRPISDSCAHGLP